MLEVVPQLTDAVFIFLKFFLFLLYIYFLIFLISVVYIYFNTVSVGDFLFLDNGVLSFQR